MAFFITKGMQAYWVTVERFSCSVEKIALTPFRKYANTISNSLQVIADNQLWHHKPGNSEAFLKEYFADKMWQVTSED